MKKVRVEFILFFTSLVIPFQAHGWGSRGHQALAEVGAKLAHQGNAFWSANASNMGMLANVPDNKWKSGSTGKTEKPLHYFEIDAYFSQPSEFEQFPKNYTDAVQKYSYATLLQNGLAPWRVKQLFDLAVAAFKKNDFKTGLQMAGTMSHYVGDLSQPLHVTTNYDGKDTGNSGIHSFFETKVVNQINLSDLEDEIKTKAMVLLLDPEFTKRFKGKPLEEVFLTINQTYTYKNEVIQNDLILGRKASGIAAQLELVKECLANGAATLAMILSELWEQAGNPTESKKLTINAPAWIAPQF